MDGMDERGGYAEIVGVCAGGDCGRINARQYNDDDNGSFECL